MKDKLFLIGALLAIVAGIALFASTFAMTGSDDIFVILSIALMFLGVILLVTGFITPSVSQSKEGNFLAYIIIIAAVMVIIGTFDSDALWPLLLGGTGLIMLTSFILWPCICCTGKSKNRDKIIGIANAHDNISMYDLSQKTGIGVDIVRDIVYDAMAKGQLIGKMEGEFFVRGRPVSTSYEPTTREREIVKVLVVCPFCGAKNEQGTPKCHNCQASL